MADREPIMNPAPDNPDWAAHANAPADTASLCALADADPDTLTGPALVDAIVASEKALSYLAGKQLRLLNAFAKPFKAGDPTRLAARLARKNCATGDDDPDQVAVFVDQAAESLAAAEVAAALRIPTITAGHRVREARTMTGVLKPTLEALETGVLDRVKARVIAEHCAPLTPDHTSTVQHLVLPRAGDLTTSELRDITGQAVITVDPDGAEQRHQHAAARRELALHALPDAMATLKAYLPADGAVKIFQVSDLLATGTAGTPGDTRGIGARRVDALVDIADQLLSNGYLDLTEYLGRELPDHATPPTRTSARNTDPDPESADNTAHTDDDHPATSDVAAEHADEIEVQFEGSPDDHDHDDEVRTEATCNDADQPQVEDADETQVDATDIDDEPVTPAPAGQPGKPESSKPERSKPQPSKPQPGKSAARVFTRQGRRPHLSVTLGLSTLAGLDHLPGTLAGFGAIPAAFARSIATSAGTISALLTNPDTGTITAAGALTYRPTQAVRDQIAVLVDTCRFPSCRQPVWRCENDHRDPFDHHHPEEGGTTTPKNIDPYCKRHHLFKHHTGWKVRPDPDRTVLHFTSPTGHHYSKHGRQAAPPHIWVSTVGADTAEQLDAMITPGTTLVDPTPRPASRVEELLTILLIRHALTTQPIEYQHDATAWDATTAERPNGEQGDNGENPDADPWNEPPPF